MLYKFLMLIVTIPLSLVKTYTYLSYVSMAGIGCALIGGLLMLGYMTDKLVQNDVPHSEMKIFDIA